MKPSFVMDTLTADLQGPGKNTGGKIADTVYESILIAHGAKYTRREHYWLVGEINKSQGWIIHLSAVLSQLPALMEQVVPLLLHNVTTFEIIQTPRVANLMLDGHLGYVNVGKMVSIYPSTDEDALQWAKKLIYLTEGFRGPQVPTDRHLGSIVYVKYGAFQPGPIPDPASIPFVLPQGISWPFSVITSPVTPGRPKLLNYAYYSLQVLKSDAKGDVLKGLYFKKLWQIKPCLIKQGRWNMTSDEDGRDIQDRLQWQYELYRELSGDLPLPRIFDYFKQQDDSYLAMEYIDGISLLKWVKTFYKYRSWLDLTPTVRQALLDIFNQVIDIIQRLHQRGFVHRDITPENFLIDRKGNIFLIDLELTWDLNKEWPDPPFTLGSPGFMSPQQQKKEKTTLKDDIYGLGSLLLFMVTDMLPEMFDADSPDRLYRQIILFTGEEPLAGIITSCRQNIPDRRPSLLQIRHQIQDLINITGQAPKEKIHDGVSSPPNLASVENTIQSAIRGLVNARFMVKEGLWVSQVQEKDAHVGNVQMGTSLCMGWHTGIAGPLWLIARAKRAGFAVDECMGSYSAGWEFIRKAYSDAQGTFTSGLYTGGAGIAIAFAEGLNSGLIMPDGGFLRDLFLIPAATSNNITLGIGWAGQVLALLYCGPWLNKPHLEELLSKCMGRILEAQRADGAWNIFASLKKGDILTGLDAGVSGICWSLLCYLEQYPDTRVEVALGRALAWLIKIKIEEKGVCGWPVSARAKMIDPWNAGQGTRGILLVLIRAFRQLRDPVYRDIAERMLRAYPARPHLIDLTLGSGYAGLGELYLEAFQAFDNPEWMERANWIIQVLLHLFHPQEPDAGYWHTAANNTSTADLFAGNSGIIYFLLKYASGQGLGHPLSPT